MGPGQLALISGILFLPSLIILLVIINSNNAYESVNTGAYTTRRSGMKPTPTRICIACISIMCLAVLAMIGSGIWAILRVPVPY